MHTVLEVICTFWQRGSIPVTSGMSGWLWQVLPSGHQTLPSCPEQRGYISQPPLQFCGVMWLSSAQWKVVDVMYTAFRPSPYPPSLFPAGCGDPRKDYKSQGSPYWDPAALASPRSLPEVQMLRPTPGLTRSEPSFYHDSQEIHKHMTVCEVLSWGTVGPLHRRSLCFWTTTQHGALPLAGLRQWLHCENLGLSVLGIRLL